jgi:PAS domain S-box-containing protein
VDGVIVSTDRGIPVIVAVSYSLKSGWMAAAWPSPESFEAPTHQALLTVGLGSAALLLGGFTAVLRMRRRVRAPLDELVSAAHRAHQAGCEAEMLHRAYWENSQEALFVVEVTLDGRFIFGGINPQHERLTGLRSEGISGKEPWECLPLEVASWVSAMYRKCIDAGEPISYEEELTLPAGKRLWETRLVPVRDPAGARIVSLLGTGRDITKRTQAEQALRLSTKHLELAQAAAGIGIWESDIEAQELCWSPEGYRLLGGNPAVPGHALDGEWRRILHPDDQDRIASEMRAFLSTRLALTLEFRIMRHGEVRWILGQGQVLRDRTGRPERIIGINLDITERKRAEQALRDSATRFQAMAETVPDILFISTPEGGCEYLSPRFHDYTGMTPSDAAGFGWASALHTEDRERILAAWPRATEKGEMFEEECRLHTADGLYRWFVVRWRPTQDSTGRPEKWFGAMTDIDALKRAQEDLRYLAGRILKAQDDERRRIARELHDSTAQNLLGVALGIDRALRMTSERPDIAKSALQESVRLVEQSQREIRTVSYLLHPPMLDEAGLPSALGWFIEGFSKRSGISIDAKITAGQLDRRLPGEIATALYRVAQEALTNVHRHSGSRSARVRLTLVQLMGREEIQLTVADKGRGVPKRLAAAKFGAQKPHETPGEVVTLGVGIVGMRERLRQLGGRLEIRSNKNGTIVHACVPLGPVT